MKLTERLLCIANNIEPFESICDIGTDHGYLPIYLKELNPNRNVVLSDVSKGSLNKAIVNCHKLSDYDYDFREGNGLEVLKEKEVDTIIIAGMGGLLISQILGKDINKSHSFKKLILQPRNHVGELRYYLSQNNFTVKKEELVKEGRFICEILVVSNEVPKIDFEDMKRPFDAIEWEVPKTLLNLKSDLLEDYLERKINREKRILLNIKESNNISKDKIDITKHNIEYLNNLLNNYETKRDN